MSEQRVTAIIITYKRPDELGQALANVLALDPAPDEIIVLDDDPEASGHNSPLSADPRVRYICPGTNTGPAGARNRAATEATGDIILFLDDDCRLEVSDAVAKLHAAFAEDDIALAAFRIRNAYTKEILPKEYPGYSLKRVDIPHDVSYFLAGGFAMRRKVFLETGGFDPLLYHGEEEVELSFRLLHAGWRIRYVPEVLVGHRTSPLGRETICRSYRLVRNRTYLAVKHLPLPFLLSHLLVWGGFALLQSIKAGQLSEFARGLRSLWADHLLAQAWGYRKNHRMTRRMYQYLQRNEGRLWY